MATQAVYGRMVHHCAILELTGQRCRNQKAHKWRARNQPRVKGHGSGVGLYPKSTWLPSGWAHGKGWRQCPGGIGTEDPGGGGGAISPSFPAGSGNASPRAPWLILGRRYSFAEKRNAASWSRTGAWQRGHAASNCCRTAPQHRHILVLPASVAFSGQFKAGALKIRSPSAK